MSGASWLVTNAFGSVVAGAYSGTAAITTYDVFGVSGTSGLSPFNGNLGFKGMPSSGSSGIFYARARTYSAGLGRFLQPDPAGYVDGLHLYAFVHNSPVNGADPTGLDCKTDEEGRIVECDVQARIPTNFPPDYTPPPPVLPSIAGGAGGAQRQNPIKNWLCHSGNSLASASDSLGSPSGKLELAGVGIGVAGLVTAQPEVAGPGFALAATGGLGSIGAGALQFGAGLLQGFGGGGFGNSLSAVATLGVGATIGRFIGGPGVSGYRTVSQRATDSTRWPRRTRMARVMS